MFLKVLKRKLQKKLVEYDNDYIKIIFESNDILPVDKDVNIHMVTIIIRAIFAQDGNYYLQLFLDDRLYKNVSVRKN